MGNIFNMDNKFFVFMGKVADLIMLNVIFVLCCLPVVTIGASLTALHYVTMKMVRNEESYIIKGFFKSFKENFKQATIINVIMLFAGLMLYTDLTIVNKMQGTLYSVLFCVFVAFTFLYTLLFLYIYPVLAKFYNTVKNTFINAFLMAVRHLPYTLLMLVVSLAPLAVLLIPTFKVQSVVVMLLFLMGFSLVAFINGHFLVKIFDKYIPEEETETVEDEEAKVIERLNEIENKNEVE